MPAPETSRPDLKELLLSEKVITLEDLNAVLTEHDKSKESLVDTLLRVGKFDDKALARILSRYYGFPIINPAVFVIDQPLLALIPRKIAEKYTAMPITRHEKTLTVALANPTNIKAIDELRSITKMRIKPAVAASGTLKKFIMKYYAEGPAAKESEPAGEQLDDLVKMIKETQLEDSHGSKSDLIKVTHETPVIKIINMLLLEGIRRHASDIFIEPWENFVRVRVRVDGLLEEIIRPPKPLAAPLVSRIKVMSELDIAEHRIPQDGRLKLKHHNHEVDMRVSILPSSFGEKVCLRILDTKNQGHDISRLGFNEQEQQVIKDSARRPHGMILVTGPTGSGKTTTLYSVLKYLDSPEVNITTVEGPVEYQMPGINQVNVKEHIGLTFPAALRSILRQDPDIILIGEIRDNVTLDIAVKAALTGHLVLSTLHTNDAASSITRMINMGLEPFLITSTILMISAQRLVRRLCPRCRQSYELDRAVLKQLELDPDKQHTFYKGRGCAQCRQSGYAGRSVITEILRMTPEVLDLIMKSASAEQIKNCAREQGMSTLRECAVRKALAGETSLEEVFRVTSEDAVEDEASPLTEPQNEVKKTDEKRRSAA